MTLNMTPVSPIGQLPVSRLPEVTDFAPPLLQTCFEVGGEKYEFGPLRGPLGREEDSSFFGMNRPCHLGNLAG